jgi:hypothetical protein
MKAIGFALLFLVVLYPIIAFSRCNEKKGDLVIYVSPLPEPSDELAGHLFVPDASRLTLY